MKYIPIAVAILFVAACSGESPYPTRAEFAQQLAPAFCTALRTCFPGDFAQSYPGNTQQTSTDQCVGALTSNVTSPDAPASCDRTQAKACVSDTWGMTAACPAAYADLPASCQGC